MPVVVINSEQDVYDVLQKHLENPNYLSEVDLQVESIGSLQFRLTGSEFHSSITPTVMKAFIELQNGLNKAYAVAKYGEANGVRLTADERKQLEFVVHVEEGSSLFSVEAGEDLTNLLVQGMSKVSGTQITAILLVIIVLWFGKGAMKDFLDYRKSKRSDEAKELQDLELIEHLKFANEQETKRAEIIAKLAAREPEVRYVKEISDESKADAIKKFSQAETISIGDDVEFTGEQAEQLVKNVRKRSKESRLDGVYRILAVDSSSDDDFRVTVQQKGTGLKFTADAPDHTLEKKHLNTLKNHEWDKTYLFLEVNATQRMSDDAVLRATITGASDIPTTDE